MTDRDVPRRQGESEDAARRERIVWRSRMLHLPLYPIVAAALVYPMVSGHARVVKHAMGDGMDAALVTLFVAALVLLFVLISLVRGEAPPTYDGLAPGERRIVDEALRTGREPSDPLRREIALERAVEGVRRGERRRQLGAAFVIAVAACLVATTWWAAGLWLVPVVVVAIHHRSSRRLATLGPAYLDSLSMTGRDEAPVVAVRDHRLTSRVDSLVLAPPFRDVRGTPRQSTLTQELARELHPRHALAGRSWVAIAESSAADDVVAVAGGEAVVVHLTWSDDAQTSRPTWSRASTAAHDNASHAPSA